MFIILRITEPANPSAKSSPPLAAIGAILAGGVVLRALVFVFAAPENIDQHWHVIQWIAAHHAIPRSLQLDESYHPPLYYLLMAPLAAWGGKRLVSAGCLLISIANLLVMHRLARRRELFSPPAHALLGLGLAAFLPQYVLFGHYISNDTLMILIGTLLSAAVYGYVAAEGDARTPRIWIAILIGLGLLTKGTFLFTGPAMSLLVGVMEFRRAASLRVAVGRTAVFCAIWLGLGCYKYVENAVYMGRPFVHNLDAHPAWAEEQRGVYKGVRTILDINPIPLIRRPILDTSNMRESYPQLVFGTFWYEHARDSDFSPQNFGYAWVGSCIYATAVIPTFVFLAGVGSAVICSLRWLRAGGSGLRDAVLASSLLLLGSNFALMMAAEARYGLWSGLHARFCFQSLAPALVLFGEGMALLKARGLWWRIACGSCIAAIGFGVLFFWINFAVIQHLLPAGAVAAG